MALAPLRLSCNNESSSKLTSVTPSSEPWCTTKENDFDAMQSSTPLKKRKLLSSSSSSSRGRRVHFDTSEPQQYTHIHANDITDDEKLAYWISPAEMKQARLEALYTLLLINHSSYKDVEGELEITKRGLEPRETQRITLARRCAVNMNKAGGENELLMNLYLLQTEEAGWAARLRGLLDEEEIAKIQSSDNVDKSGSKIPSSDGSVKSIQDEEAS